MNKLSIIDVANSVEDVRIMYRVDMTDNDSGYEHYEYYDPERMIGSISVDNSWQYAPCVYGKSSDGDLYYLPALGDLDKAESMLYDVYMVLKEHGVYDD